MSESICTCKWNPDGHDDDCPVFLKHENARLQSEVERLRGRCGELEAAFAGASDLIMRIHNALHYGEIYQWNDGRECWQEMDDFADGYKHGAWLLRKQAEAVERMCSQWFEEAESLPYQHEQPSKGCSTYNWQTHYAKIGESYAQRLRQQADELEAES